MGIAMGHHLEWVLACNLPERGKWIGVTPTIIKVHLALSHPVCIDLQGYLVGYSTLNNCPAARLGFCIPLLVVVPKQVRMSTKEEQA